MGGLRVVVPSCRPIWFISWLRLLHGIMKLNVGDCFRDNLSMATDGDNFFMIIKILFLLSLFIILYTNRFFLLN